MFLALGLAIAVIPPGAAGADVEVVFFGRFTGDFVLSLATTPGNPDDYRFTGSGDPVPIGHTNILGSASVRLDADACWHLLDNLVQIATPTGNVLDLRTDGTVCVDPLAPAGPTHVRGAGTFQVTGGQGAYEGAVGEGVWTMDALIEWAALGRIFGHFDPMVYQGSFTVP